MPYVEGPTKTFPASGPLGAYRRVRLDVNEELVYAGATDTDCIGITTRPAFEQGDPIAVRLRNADGTFLATAAAAYSVGPIFAAANGQVAGTGTVSAGLALEAATAPGDLTEFLV
jgi:hypothetical protein